MVANNAWPLRLPRRAFGGVVFTRVAYASSVLGPVGWLARWGKRGAVPLETREQARAANGAFDHAEMWLRIDDGGERRLDDRILVGHPYGFDERMRAELTAAAVTFDFAWSASPPGTSWYAPGAWLILAHPKHLLPIPAPEELDEPRRRTDRRPLRPGEFATTVVVESVAEAKRLAKRQYNRQRYEAQRSRPMSLGEILADPKKAMARVNNRRRAASEKP